MAPTPADGDGLRGLKVLVIDNVELLLVSMSKTLSAWDCQVSSARNLAEALDCARQEWPDVLVTDFHLGDREPDGLELVKALREQALADFDAVVPETAHEDDLARVMSNANLIEGWIKA